ncbi:MAG: NAD-dependent epimerase/dehydratase family protein [Alphaproteobacteria bacterium]|nr:NAD-dependent epimerase/dehydratase family protein [Alphaproteobacteria bacterium]
MKTLLVTGSKGLIGSALSVCLNQLGFVFKPFDVRFDPGHSGAGDIRDKDSVRKAVEGSIGIIHLAGTSRVISGEKDPELCWEQNVEGTENVIEAALNSPLKPWVVYASSREVYGQQDLLPVAEDTVLRPMNVYAYSKVAAEKRIKDAREEGLITSILRFSNVFGSPFDHEDRVIPAFCRAALLGENLYVEGAENTFDFTFVDDVVRGIAAVVGILTKCPQNLPPIHFTTGRGITLKEAASIITERAKSFSLVKEMPPRSFDVSRFYGNPSRAKELLGWMPQFSFEEAIDRFLLSLENHLRFQNILLDRSAA